MSDPDVLPFHGVLDSPPALRWHGHPSEDWESSIAAAEADESPLLAAALASGHFTRPGCAPTALEVKRFQASEKMYRMAQTREERNAKRRAARRERIGLPAEPAKKERPVISLAQFVEQGKAELERAAERARVARVAIEAAEAERARLAQLELERRKRAWAKRGRAGLVADLTAVGWQVDAKDLKRIVLRRGEGMIALTLPFSPADACELEDRHRWAFLPWS